MKKTIVLVLIFALIFGTVSINANGNTYELWTESPYVTSGITSNDLNIYRAKNISELDLYPLSRLGSNYYLAICEEKWTDGGYNGNQKTSRSWIYLILVNGGDFIVLSSRSFNQEYYWDRGILINNLSDKVTNTGWYTSRGSQVPYYVIQPLGRYSHSQYTGYLEQIIITSGGGMYYFSTVSDNSCHEYPTAYNNILYSRVDRYQSGSYYYYYYIEGSSSTRAARLTPYLFINGAVSYDTASRLLPQLTTVTAANGYTMYVDSFPSNVSTTSTAIINSKSSVFPDGRRVETYWMGMGNYLYEVWYRIYNADGTLRANGPTGYSTTFSSSFDTYPLLAIPINNSKFMMCVNKIGHSFIKEYYRVAVVSETITGEINTGGSIGTKNIIPPASDTEPVQSSIDFEQDNLPLGYNIKNNVVGSNKLDSILRQQVNTIRLNDIVILKKSGYISGTQNTGVALGSYSVYDYGFGSGDYIRFYSNGQNFLYYCYYPETLAIGTYNKTFYWGDKTIYVTVKIIAPPNNSGVTSVTF